MAQAGPTQGASKRKGRSESERTNRRNKSPAGIWLQDSWSAKSLQNYSMASAGGSNWDGHVPGSRRNLKAAIPHFHEAREHERNHRSRYANEQVPITTSGGLWGPPDVGVALAWLIGQFCTEVGQINQL